MTYSNRSCAKQALNNASALIAIILSAAVAITASKATALDPPLLCEKIAGLSLVKCVKKLANAERKCFKKTGVACTPTNPDLQKPLDKLAEKVIKKCSSDANVQAAGFGPLTLASLTERLQATCRAESASLIARSFGGPHGAAWIAASKDDKKCLDKVFKSGRKVLTGSAKAQMKCVDKERKGSGCDTAKTSEKIAKLETKASTKIAASCGADLNTLIAVDAATYIARAQAQSRCMTAIAHPDTTPLALDCGPRTAVSSPPRGAYVQIVLDEATWGTRCGDGSSYAFWIRLAPTGSPVENVVVQMQGGGVCIFEGDCNSRPAGLFEALNDNPGQSGIMSNDAGVSPFANWTKVFMPYCTQDIFAGGGTTSAFPSITVHRYGAVNLRGAMRYLRDVLWREMDNDSEGYRPDRIRMLFGGTSAGAFGTLYNYHYVLDDLQWTHATAWPDSALALDNGQALGIAALGGILISDIPPVGWGALHFMPPYCFQTDCGLGERIYETSAPRLKREPEQQFLVLSNQWDNTQVSTTFFDTTDDWVNALRQSYCDTMGTNGLNYFLPAIASSRHVIATNQSLFTGQSVDGILMRDWLDLAISDPDSVFDAVEEGTLTTAIPGVNTFPCTID